MKHILFSRLLSALLVVCASVMFFACQKEAVEPPAPEALAYKDLTIQDVSGQNSMVVRVHTADPALLHEQDWAKAMQVEALTAAPSEPFDEKGDQAAAPGSSTAEVNFEILSQQMQPGVKALALRFTPQASNERWQWVYTLTTSKDNIKVTANSGCHAVYYYKRPTYSSGFIYMGGWGNRCAFSWTQATSIGSYQMRTQVYYNNGASFTVTTW